MKLYRKLKLSCRNFQGVGEAHKNFLEKFSPSKILRN